VNDDQQINESAFHPSLWKRFWSLTWPYWASEEKRSARVLFIIVVLLSAAVVGLNVVLTYVNNYLLTALALRNIHDFYKWLFVIAGIFVVGTPIVVYAQYTQNKLGNNWRRWLTENLLRQYFQNRAYYTVNLHSNVDNPDQRLTQDANDFTALSLNFLLTAFQSALTFIGFFVVLLSISHTLTWIMLLYAIGGSAAVFLFGRKLVTLNFQQQRLEANFRYGMVRVRDNTEAIAFYRGEAAEVGQATSLLLGAIRNFNMLIGWQRNLGMFTTGYNYFVVIIPYLVVAPLYFAHKVSIGEVQQAGNVFGQILAAASIIVSSFQGLTGFAATVDRLSNFNEAINAPIEPAPGERIQTETAPRIALDDVTVETPDGQRALVRNLTATVTPGEGLLIVGPSGGGKSSLLRAIAGLWQNGAGQIERPEQSEMLFLPQTPYTVQGSLRRQLLYPRQPEGTLDANLHAVLADVSLGDLAERVGGLDAERNWDTLLSLGERQRLAFARLLLARPTYAVLDEATSALDGPNESRLYERLREICPYYVSVGHNPSLRRFHKNILELDGATHWNLSESAEYVPSEVRA
jgi:putative ATP-binding cassette transporter